VTPAGLTQRIRVVIEDAGSQSGSRADVVAESIFRGEHRAVDQQRHHADGNVRGQVLRTLLCKCVVWADDQSRSAKRNMTVPMDGTTTGICSGASGMLPSQRLSIVGSSQRADDGSAMSASPLCSVPHRRFV